MSPEALEATGAQLRGMRINRRTGLTLARSGPTRPDRLNPIGAGCMRYCGRFYRSALSPLLQRITTYLRRWAGKKYRQLLAFKRFKRWWTGLLERQPSLFTHWQWVRSF